MITYTFLDAWNAGQMQWRSGVESKSWVFATNMAISKMWRSYDWRGTVLPFTPFWLVPGDQDYGKPFWRVPTDFYGIRECYLVQIGSNAIPVRTPLQVVENLQATHVAALPQCICYRPSIQGFRIHPAASYGASSPLYMIDGTYKTRPPKITQSLSSSLLFWDDVYFEIFVQALAWAVLVTSGERKAAMEQHAIFLQTLAEGTGAENLELGEPSIHPTEPLLVPNAGLWGMSPW